MAHMIDTTTGQAAIAYVGATPWHGLGAKMSDEATMQEWAQAAGLGYTVERETVQYMQGGELRAYDDRHVLFRNDTGKPLSVVSKDYKIVQPAEVMDFFEKLTEIGGFMMETAGALSDGKRIWALAKVSEGAPIFGSDLVKPYVLLSTSYDATMATVGKLTAIRVVCNNTLTAAVNGSKTEIRMPHTEKFNADEMRLQLGIFENSFDKWLIQTRKLAEREIDLDQAGKLTAELIAPTLRAAAPGVVVDVKEAKGYKRIMELFDGAAVGSDMAGHTMWGFVNAVTQWVDHERGRTGASRLNAAWFGDGDRLKSKAYELAAAE